MSVRRAVCLLSGGPDSVVAAGLTRADGYELSGLFVDYEQRTSSREAETARRNARWLGVTDFRVARVPFLGQLGASALTDRTLRVSEETKELEYVPFRNTILISLAVAWAEAIGGDRVVIGSIGGPWITPDNNPRYFEAMNRLIAAGSRAGITVHAPLGAMSKVEVLRTGLAQGLDLGATWSCQNDGDRPCQECNNCRDRSGAFVAAGMTDPLL